MVPDVHGMTSLRMLPPLCQTPLVHHFGPKDPLPSVTFRSIFPFTTLPVPFRCVDVFVRTSFLGCRIVRTTPRINTSSIVPVKYTVTTTLPLVSEPLLFSTLRSGPIGSRIPTLRFVTYLVPSGVLRVLLLRRGGRDRPAR